MKILIPSIQVPFIDGGAKLMTRGLKDALITCGHEVEIVTVPFKFSPESYIENLSVFCAALDCTDYNGFQIDMVIPLQFPAYYVKHDRKIVWLMHQHRAVYELFDAENASGDQKIFRDKIIARDTAELSGAENLFSMSKNVSNRLAKYNGLKSVPVYHPPYGSHKFYCQSPYNYIFFPSRLESLKRQDLLIEAMRHVKTPIKAIIAGVGGQRDQYAKLIAKYDLQDSIRLIGQISEAEKHVLYARSLGVFFGPFDEDYGYITLEAMLSAKPVITCTDSGGPLEFIENGNNGFVVEPKAELIAEKLDWLWENRNLAIEMGKAGLAIYRAKGISWQNVVQQLIGT